jgi:hypothetical protein
MARPIADRIKRRRLPNVDVPKVEDQSLREHLEGIKEHIRMYEGDSGAPKERFATLEELEAAGLVTLEIKQKFAQISEVLGNPVPKATSSSPGAAGQTYNNTYVTGASTLRDLDDTNVDGIAGGDGIVWNGSFYVPTPLPAFDFALAKTYDMVFKAVDGWTHTDQELQWNPDLDYMQFAHAHSINWLNVAGSTVQLLELNSSGAGGGDTVDYEIVSVAGEVATTGASYVDVTGAQLDQNNLVEGDEYLLLCNTNMRNSISTTQNDDYVRLVDQDGAQLTGSEYRMESCDGSATAGYRYGYVNWITATLSGDDEISFQHKNVGVGNCSVSDIRMFAISLTDLGASNWARDRATGTTSIPDSAGWTTVETIELPSAGDWLIFGCVQCENHSATSSVPHFRLHDGASTVAESKHDVGDTVATPVVSLMGLIEGASALADITLDCTNDESGFTYDVEFRSIVAIRLDAFSEHEVKTLADPTDPAGAGEYTLDTLSWTAVNTADFLAFGGINEFWDASGLSGGNELNAQADGGGYSNISGLTSYREDMQSAKDNVMKIIFPHTALSVTAAEDIDIQMQHLPAPSHTTDEVTKSVIVAFSTITGSTLVEDFEVGHMSYQTSILGSNVDIETSLDVTGASTFASTLAVTGAATLSSTLDVTGAVTMGSTVEITGVLDANGRVDANAGLYVYGDSRIYDSGGTDFLSQTHDDTDFNWAFTNTTDWNITGIDAITWATYNALAYTAGAPSATATWDTSDKSAATVLSNGNLTATVDEASWAGGRAHADLYASTGKWYWELTIGTVSSPSYHMHGSAAAASFNVESSYPGGAANSYGMQSSGTLYGTGKSGAGVSYVATDVLMFALDMDAGKLWIGKNGTWIGDPVAATGHQFSGITADQAPAYAAYNAGADVVTLNAGSSAFAHTVPTGYTSLDEVAGLGGAGFIAGDATVNYEIDALEITLDSDVVVTGTLDVDLTIVDVTTTSYTVLDLDDVILVDDDTAGAAVTITLPAVATAAKRRRNIKKLGTTAEVIIDGNSTETIDGAQTATLYVQYESVALISDGTEWHII